MINDLTDLRIPLLSFGFEGNASDYDLGGNSITLTGTTNSTRIVVLPDGSATVTINCPLVITNGGRITVDNDSANLISQATSQLRLNGSITLNGGELELLLLECEVGAGYKSIAYVTGPISGSGGIRNTVHRSCGGSVGSYVEFNGPEPNTFEGTLVVGEPGNLADAGKIVLNKPTGVAVVPDTVRLVVEHGSVVQLNSSEQIGDNATVEIHSGGQLRLENFFETIGDLILLDHPNSADTRPPGVETGTGQLGLNSSLTCSRSSTNLQAVPRIRGAVNFNGFIPIRVSGTPDPGLQIDASIVGNGFDKLGAGTLRLAGTNSFFGDAAATEGTIEALASGVFGQPGPFFGVHLNGGNVVLQSVAIGAEPLFVNSPASLLTAIGPCSWAGPVTLNAEFKVAALDPTFSDVAFNFAGSISGSGGLLLLSPLFGVGNVRLSGSTGNSFTGPLTVNCQRLELNKPSGTNAYAGPLIVGRPGSSGVSEVRWLNRYQKVGATLTLYSNGVVNLNGFNEDFGPITFNGGRVETGAGQFAIYQPLTVNPSDVSAIINGNLGLPPGNAVFNVSNGAADCDLMINAAVFGGASFVVKQGPGTLCLTAANSYAGTTLLEEGILDVNNGNALGAANATVIFSNATLRLNGSGTMVENFEIIAAGVSSRHGVIEAMPNSSFTLNGSILLDAASVINVGQSAGIGFNGVISGTGPLIKTGPGNLVLSGAANNTYAGDTLVNAGALFLSKSAGRLAVPGNLYLGPASSNAVAVGRFLRSGGIGGSMITVNANSLLDLNGFSQTVTRLNLNDGGDVQTGAGTLNFSGGAVVAVGSLSLLGSHASSSISGSIGLPPNDNVTFNVNAYAASFPFDFRPELDVPAAIPRPVENISFAPAEITKEGSGWMRLGGNNTYRGNTIINGGTLQVDGAQPQSSVMVNPGAQLRGIGTIGHVFMNGTSAALAPGDSAGIFTCSNFNSGGGSGTLQIELNGTAPGSGYDQVNVRGTVRLTGISLSASLNFPSSVNDQFVVINNDGADAVLGTFTGLPQNATFYIGSEQFAINYTGGTGNDIVLTRLPTPPRPVLAIEQLPPAFVRLLWPTSAVGFTLQSNTNLNTTNWASAAPASVISGINNVVTNVTDGVQKFYRLFKP
jgi:autotransporter-associated beta strand protein